SATRSADSSSPDGSRIRRRAASSTRGESSGLHRPTLTLPPLSTLATMRASSHGVTCVSTGAFDLNMLWRRVQRITPRSVAMRSTSKSGSHSPAPASLSRCRAMIRSVPARRSAASLNWRATSEGLSVPKIHIAIRHPQKNTDITARYTRPPLIRVTVYVDNATTAHERRLFGEVDVTADVASGLAQRAAEALGLRVVALGEHHQVAIVDEGDDLVDDRLHPGVAGDRDEPGRSQRDHAPALVDERAQLVGAAVGGDAQRVGHHQDPPSAAVTAHPRPPPAAWPSPAPRRSRAGP